MRQLSSNFLWCETDAGQEYVLSSPTDWPNFNLTNRLTAKKLTFSTSITATAPIIANEEIIFSSSAIVTSSMPYTKLAGGLGVSGVGANGNLPVDLTNVTSFKGGIGGNSNSNTGANPVVTFPMGNWLTPQSFLGGTSINAAFNVVPLHGGGPGGGGAAGDIGAASGTGGAGGAGGGILVFAAQRITINSGANISANGSNGANGSGSGGGGGGGGGSGGTIVFICNEFVTSGTGMVRVNGGNGGNASGAGCIGGGGGSAGIVYVFNLTDGSFARYTSTSGFVTATAGSAGANG